MVQSLSEKVAELIYRRRRQVLIHSYLYYEMNINLISDHTYDHWCKELADLQASYPEISGTVDFYKKEYADFDGGTGYHLPKEPWMHEKAVQLINYKRERIVR